MYKTSYSEGKQARRLYASYRLYRGLVSSTSSWLLLLHILTSHYMCPLHTCITRREQQERRWSVVVTHGHYTLRHISTMGEVKGETTPPLIPALFHFSLSFCGCCSPGKKKAFKQPRFRLGTPREI